VTQMVEISMEVSSGAAPLHVAVRAENIHRAASIVVAQYPGGDCRERSETLLPLFFRLAHEAGLSLCRRGNLCQPGPLCGNGDTLVDLKGRAHEANALSSRYLASRHLGE
jgi:hypothetical protein